MRILKLNRLACFLACILFISSVSANLSANTMMPTPNLDQSITKTLKQLAVQSAQTEYVTECDWPNWGYDAAHTCYTESPAPNTTHVLWKYGPADLWDCQPLVYRGRVYFHQASYRTFSCLDAVTGQTIWNIDFHELNLTSFIRYGRPALGLTRTPVIAWDRIYLTIVNYTVCINAYSGNILWVYDHQTWCINGGINVYTEKLSGGWRGLVYVLAGPKEDTRLYCLDAITGKLKWIHYFAPQYSYVDLGIGHMAIANGNVYVPGTISLNLFCFDQETGKLKWVFTGGDYTDYGVAAGYGKVYMPCKDGNLYAIDAQNGTLVWKYHFGGFVEYCPGLAYGKVYCGSYDWWFRCLDAETGKPVWEFQDLNGTSPCIWQGSPAISHGKVYMGNNNGNLYSFDAETGKLYWKFFVGGHILGAGPTISNGKLYIAGTSQFWKNETSPLYLYCLGQGPTTTSASFVSPRVNFGEAASIYGNVADNSQARPGAPAAGVNVTLMYSLFGAEEFTTIANVSTDSTGRFFFEWTPPRAGSYILRASFAGDNDHESSFGEATVQVTDTTMPSYVVPIITIVGVVIICTIAGWLYIRKQKTTKIMR